MLSIEKMIRFVLILGLAMCLPVASWAGMTAFSVEAPDAGKVAIAGSFNEWKTDQYFLQKDGDGKWSIELDLAPGNYEYKFLADGEWDKLGKDNLKITVKAGAPTAGSASAEGPTTFTYTDANAKSVHLAGEFNAWLDNDNGRVSGHEDWSMKNDGGKWTITVSLKPGKYKFKYAIDGGARWEKDPNMPASDDDNSLVSVSGGAAPSSPAPEGKTTFAFTDDKASTVHVAGEFNAWLDNDNGRVSGHEDWAMKNEGGKWTIAVALKPGSYKFKYVIDGGERWEKDPNMPASDDDNSLVTVAGKTAGSGQTKTKFSVKAPDAEKVALAGSFNEWKTDQYELEKGEDGMWSIDVDLAPGSYEYKFLQDGDWDKLGKDNQKITVKASGAAPASASKKTTLSVKAPGAGKVSVAGSFNEWNMDQYHLEKGEGDMWSIDLDLAPGSHEYKFIQDGDWDKLNKDNQKITVK